MKKIVIIFIVSVLAGCAKTVYIPVESIRTEYKDKYHRDSIYILDSVYVREKEDTIFKDRWRIEYRDRLRVDSFCQVDSIKIPYPVEVIKKVEKKLTWWQKLRIYLGNIALGFCMVYFGLGLMKRKIKL